MSDTTTITSAAPRSTATPKAPSASLMSVTVALARREFTRFIRQPQRVVGSLGQPLLFWIFLGAGFRSSFHAPGMHGMSYIEYFYPGVLMMMILFAAVFSTITVIEDRDQGFLQGVIVAPVPRLSIALGKIFGGTIIALFQAVILLLATPFMGFPMTLGGLGLVIMAMILTGIGYTALGFAIAWGMKSTSGFHAIMMVFLMPLWLLSGALFPMTGAPTWLTWVMTINPVAHAMTVLRAPFYASVPQVFADTHYLISLVVLLAWVILGLWVSVRRVSKRDHGA